MASRTMKKTSTTVEKADTTNKNVDVKELKTKKEFEKDEYITCRSVTIGTLIMTGSKSNEDYRWEGYGDCTDVKYQDLTSLVAKKSDYLFHPYFVVEDEDFIEQHPTLEKFYESQFTTTDLEEILDMDVRSMVANIERLPKGAKDTLKIMTSNKVFAGEIDSLSKIKALDEIFGTEINLLSNLI